MRIYSLKVRDDAKEDPGYAVVKLSGLELIALYNILSKTAKEAKEAKRYSNLLAGMVCVTHTANALVQHGCFDRFDLKKLEEKLRNGGKSNADSGGD